MAVAAAAISLVMVDVAVAEAALPDAPTQRLDIVASDIVWDATRGVLYASVRQDSPVHPDELVTIDPATGLVVASRSLGTQPGQLAITPEADAIYVGVDGRGEVQKFSLPDFTPGWSHQFGMYSGRVMIAGDIEVVPGASDVIAVSRRVVGLSPGLAGVQVIDGGVARPNTTSGHTGSDLMVFGADASTLYGSQTGSSAERFLRNTVDESGVIELDDTSGLGGSDIVYHDGLVYGANGLILDATGDTIRIADTLPDAHTVAIESGSNRIVYVRQITAGNPTATIATYDVVSRQSVGEWNIPGVTGSGWSLVSMGAGSFAFLDRGHPARTYGNLVLVDIGGPASCNGVLATITGTDGADTLTGTAGPDVIAGLGGDDIIDGLGGDDLICGDGGNDVIRGMAGADTLFGGDGDDRIFAGHGNDIADGGSGNDKIYGGNGNDVLRGDAGDDKLYGHADDDDLDGGVGDDRVAGGSGQDDVRGGPGRDRLFGDEDDDVLDGGDSHDLVKGGAGNDHIRGGSGNDVLDGGSGAHDEMWGELGKDVLRDADGAHTAFGGGSTDDIRITYPAGWTDPSGVGLVDGIEGGPGSDVVQITLGTVLQVIVDGDGRSISPGQSVGRSDRLELLGEVPGPGSHAKNFELGDTIGGGSASPA